MRLIKHPKGDQEPEIDSHLTPSTPITQPGTFGVIEPPSNAINGDIIIPIYEYKWNQIAEIQLSDGKKVRFE